MTSLGKRGWIVVALCLILAGCAQKPAEEAGNNESAAAPTGKARSSGEASRRTSARAKPAPVAATIPSGTELDVRLITPLSSKENKEGDTFEGTLENPVVSNSNTVIPKGADVTGRVTSAVSSGRLKQRAELWVTLTSVKIGEKEYEIQTNTGGQKEGSKATRDILFIGGGSGAGAAIGGAAGGGKGAGIGAAIGAAAGTAGAMMTGKREVQFPSESVLRFELTKDLVIRP
jgi:hypothetical protein